MPKPSIMILGAGSQAKVVVDLIRTLGAFEPSACVDLNPQGSRVGGAVLGVPVVTTIDKLSDLASASDESFAALAIGDAQARKTAFEAAEACGLAMPMLIHPSAIVSSGAAIGAGSVIAAQAYVGVEASIGVGVIVNTAAGVDHDGDVGDFAHIAVGARLAGNVTVGAGALIGAGATAIPGVNIGAGATVAAGAVVTGDIPEFATAMGVPAKVRV